MIGFTVMDHDVITANDFAGEAFLSLNNIPGVSECGSIENFHGLKQIYLVLMQQKDKREHLKILVDWTFVAINGHNVDKFLEELSVYFYRKSALCAISAG